MRISHQPRLLASLVVLLSMAGIIGLPTARMTYAWKPLYDFNNTWYWRGTLVKWRSDYMTNIANVGPCYNMPGFRSGDAYKAYDSFNTAAVRWSYPNNWGGYFNIRETTVNDYNVWLYCTPGDPQAALAWVTTAIRGNDGSILGPQNMYYNNANTIVWRTDNNYSQQTINGTMYYYVDFENVAAHEFGHVAAAGDDYRDVGDNNPKSAGDLMYGYQVPDWPRDQPNVNDGQASGYNQGFNVNPNPNWRQRMPINGSGFAPETDAYAYDRGVNNFYDCAQYSAESYYGLFPSIPKVDGNSAGNLIYFQGCGTGDWPYAWNRLYDKNHLTLAKQMQMIIKGGMLMEWWQWNNTGEYQVGIDLRLENPSTGETRWARDFPSIDNRQLRDQNGVLIHPAFRPIRVGRWDFYRVDLTPATGWRISGVYAGWDTGGYNLGNRQFQSFFENLIFYYGGY